MFPYPNLAPESNRWANTVQKAITDLEARQPSLDNDLARLQRTSNSVLADVSSSINAYYTNTLVQYPVIQKFLTMDECLGGDSKTVSISAPAAANNTVAENWVSVFTHNITLPAAKTVAGFRLNNAQFMLLGSSTYIMRFRWRVNTVSEGLLTNKWMSRHEFNLREYAMSPGGQSTLLTNRYVHWSGASASTFQIELQASIQNAATRGASVAAQDITFRPFDLNGLDTYLDLMVTT